MIDNISILMPVYNDGEYLKYSISSILNQSFKNFEFLIVDDGSTDNTEEEVKKFSDTRIKYIKKENGGLAKSLNYGLKIAKYDWVARMDADDISHPLRLEQQIKCISETNTICCSYYAFFKDKKIVFTVETPLSDSEIKSRLCLHPYFAHSSVVYNRKFILENSGYDEKYKVYEDFELWLRIKDKVKFVVVPEYLLFVKVRNNSLSSSKVKGKEDLIRLTLERYYENFEKSFDLKDRKSQIKIKGWKDYFYGQKNNAREEWLMLKWEIIISPKILIASLFTFFPQRYFEFIRSLNITPHLKYFRKSLKIKRYLNKTLISLLNC